MSKGNLCLVLATVLTLGCVQEQSVWAKSEMDDLLDLYLSFDLPLPPKGSQIVLVKSGYTSREGEQYYTPSFAHRLDSGQTEYYFGTRIRTWKDVEDVPFTTVDNSPGPLMFSEPSVYTGGRYETNVMREDLAIAIAMQAHALGMTDQAKELLGADPEWVNAGAGGLADSYGPPRNPSKEQRIAYLALHSAMNDWGLPGSNAEEISSRVNKVIGSGLITLEWHDRYLKRDIEALKRATEPFPKPRNRVQELIAEIVAGQGRVHVTPSADGPVAKLIAMGDSALPDVVDFLDDNRLTRYYFLSFGNGSSSYMTLDMMMSLIVSEIIDDPILERSSFTPSRSAVYGYLEWKETGDRNAFLKGLILPDFSSSGDRWRTASSHRNAAIELIENDPAEFETVYLEMFDQHPYVGSGLVYVVRNSDLPDRTKQRLLLAGAEGKIFHHSVTALEHIVEFNEDRFHRLLNDRIMAIPAGEIDSETGWAISSIARLVAIHGEDSEWKQLELSVPKLRPGTRAIVLTHMVNLFGVDVHPQESRMLHLMSAFLDDAGAPNIENPYVKHHILNWRDVDRTLSVGDLVAIELNEYFGGGYLVRETYGPETVKNLRKVVDEELRERNVRR